MRIGVDFDNTIVCYDALFHRVALEQGLIPADLSVTKRAVRDHLRSVGREDDWTEMQGLVYGLRLCEAEAYPGVVDFFRRARELGVPICVISHKTRHPYRGEPYDLHAAAREWLDLHAFDVPVWLELTKEAKLARIAAEGCTHFIDDLPEFLALVEPPTERILFDPADGHADEPGCTRVTSWAEAAEWLLAGKAPGRHRGLPLQRDDGTLEAAAARLVGGAVTLAPLTGGGNNRVFRVDTNDGPRVLKAYFHHPDDPRDRLGAEWAFLRYAWDRGLRCVPEPLACDREQHLGLYSFVDGRRVEPGEVTAEALAQAVEFCAALNTGSPDLPTASEACFTFAEHHATVDRRLARLASVGDEQVRAFLRDELTPAWEPLAERLPTDTEPAERVVSPSDFGFHNALWTAPGTLAFLDFEYAGWDDPAKLICDFLCQPQVPVPPALHAEFLDAVCATRPDPARLRVRALALLPVYRVKWCCILLNEFLPAGAARRGFAGGLPAEVGRRQLDKARKMLAAVG